MAKKKVAPKKEQPSSKAAVNMGDSKIDPNQRQLSGMESERIAQIETAVKKIVDMKSQRSAIKEEIDGLLCKLPPLFEKHELTSYSCYGKIISIEPGASIVKIKKAKTQ